MNKRKAVPAHTATDELDRLWRLLEHDDSLLATRVSSFLLTQSILIAVTASLVDTVAELHRISQHALRREMFGLSLAITAVGVALTFAFWYVFTLNYDNVGAAIDILRAADPLYEEVMKNQATRRNSHWYFRLIFRRKGMNWIVVNVLPAAVVLLWLMIGSFALAIFL